jgi:hypothetical protein
MKLNFFKTASTLLFAAIVGLSSCSKNDDSTIPGDPAQSTAAVKIVTDAKFGSVLTDNAGHTLYFLPSMQALHLAAEVGSR